MKLLEILSTSISKHNDTYTPAFFNPVNPDTKSGTNRKVWNVDDWSVDRLSNKENIGSIEDGFMLYALLIKKYNLAESNPFFPRIYNMQFYIKDGEKRVKYNIEKLFPLSDLSYEDFKIIFSQIFSKEYSREILYAVETESINDNFAIIDALDNFMNGNRKQIINTELIEALTFINKILYKYNRTNDISSHNVMFRRGPYGPQLVITDPIY